MNRPSRIALAVFVGVPLILVILASQRTHGHLTFTVRVHGELRLPHRNEPRPRVFVMVMPDRELATDPRWTRCFHEDAVRAWTEPPGPRTPSHDEHSYAPLSVAGARLNEDEQFTVNVTVRWTVSYLGPIRLNRPAPPPRYDLGVLRIEIEGRDPVILDAPTGTWTEHPDEDGLWATWDLGVVEVPGGTATGN